MSDPLSELPDETPCYVEGYGLVELGTIRGANGSRNLADEWEGTLRMWTRKATRNLCLRSWEKPGAGPPEGKA